MITIEPLLPIPIILPVNPNDPMNNYIYYPAFIETENDSDKYLSSLDSDTRAYVINHTDESRSKSDIIDCVYRLRNENQE